MYIVVKSQSGGDDVHDIEWVWRTRICKFHTLFSQSLLFIHVEHNGDNTIYSRTFNMALTRSRWSCCSANSYWRFKTKYNDVVQRKLDAYPNNEFWGWYEDYERRVRTFTLVAANVHWGFLRGYWVVSYFKGLLFQATCNLLFVYTLHIANSLTERDTILVESET